MIQPPILHWLCFLLFVCMTVNLSRHTRFSRIKQIWSLTCVMRMHACAFTGALKIIVRRVSALEPTFPNILVRAVN